MIKFLCDDPILSELPYKVETNKQGQIIMTPHSTFHSDYQWEIAFILKKLITNGRVSGEFAVVIDGIQKTIDVCWRTRIGKEKVSPVAPELCIEVLSPNNSKAEMELKKELYFKAGAREFWLCTNGKMEFFNQHRKLKLSLLFPAFPQSVKI